MTVEGIEARAEYDWLRSRNIRYYQGFLLACAGFESLPVPDFPRVAGASECFIE